MLYIVRTESNNAGNAWTGPHDLQSTLEEFTRKVHQRTENGEHVELVQPIDPHIMAAYADDTETWIFVEIAEE